MNIKFVCSDKPLWSQLESRRGFLLIKFHLLGEKHIKIKFVISSEYKVVKLIILQKIAQLGIEQLYCVAKW